MKKHWNLKYIIARLWQKIYTRKHPDSPWMTAEVIKLLDQLIMPSDKGIEFGSGRSTRWFASRCSYLISVENNKEWYNYVSKQLDSLKNVDYHYKLVNTSSPAHSEYLDPINSLADESMDFIINDGKLRDYVAIHSISKLKNGGIYILDDAERYLPNDLKLPSSLGNKELNTNWILFKQETEHWRKIWTTDGVSSTLLLFKI